MCYTGKFNICRVISRENSRFLSTLPPHLSNSGGGDLYCDKLCDKTSIAISKNRAPLPQRGVDRKGSARAAVGCQSVQNMYTEQSEYSLQAKSAIGLPLCKSE
jgi:hypothetical protein